MARADSEFSGSAITWLATGLLAILFWTASVPVWGASFAPKDLRVLSRAIAFMQPPPAPDAIIAIVWQAGNADSKRDADAIAALIGEGLPVGHTLMRPKIIDSNSLDGAVFQVVIAAEGANGPRLSAAARAAKALCVTSDIEAVRTGLCTMAIVTEPRVQIIVNHAATVAAGIEFATAFRLMIQEM